MHALPFSFLTNNFYIFTLFLLLIILCIFCYLLISSYFLNYYHLILSTVCFILISLLSDLECPEKHSINKMYY